MMPRNVLGGALLRRVVFKHVQRSVEDNGLVNDAEAAVAADAVHYGNNVLLVKSRMPLYINAMHPVPLA